MTVAFHKFPFSRINSARTSFLCHSPRADKNRAHTWSFVVEFIAIHLKLLHFSTIFFGILSVTVVNSLDRICGKRNWKKVCLKQNEITVVIDQFMERLFLLNFVGEFVRNFSQNFLQQKLHRDLSIFWAPICLHVPSLVFQSKLYETAIQIHVSVIPIKTCWKTKFSLQWLYHEKLFLSLSKLKTNTAQKRKASWNFHQSVLSLSLLFFPPAPSLWSHQQSEHSSHEWSAIPLLLQTQSQRLHFAREAQLCTCNWN